ncbi:hypothetical protein CLF_111076 [Clonorchis sinensis]|uniref:Uncharacterized protein n=1 Tax=Clonorchis sinensis TaxID=79923 RepID=G7YLE1_CLOSI|nr:hypothetical protein CLF_111076 [Clonorchis sinensis]
MSNFDSSHAVTLFRRNYGSYERIQVAWQLGTERVLQLNDFFQGMVSSRMSVSNCNIGFEFCPMGAPHRRVSLIVPQCEEYPPNRYIWTRKRVLLPIGYHHSEILKYLKSPTERSDVRFTPEKCKIAKMCDTKLETKAQFGEWCSEADGQKRQDHHTVCGVVKFSRAV